MPSPHESSPADEIADAMRCIYRLGLTTTSGGNISIRDDDGGFWITPSGLDKAELDSEDVARVRGDGSTAGPHRPSSEHPSHRSVYDARGDLRAIVHAHPAALVTFAICRTVPDTGLLPAAETVCGRVAYAAYAHSGSDALAATVAGRFEEGHDCVLLENHGIMVGGRSLEEAFDRFETLEQVARILIEASRIGTPRQPAGDVGALVGGLSGDWREGRTELPTPPRPLLALVERGWRRGLLNTRLSSFSSRDEDGGFLIAAPGLRPRLAHLPIGGAGATWGTAGVAVIHEAIYRQHPSVGSVAVAAPAHATALALTGAPLDPRVMPEALVVLRDLVTTPAALLAGPPERLAETVSQERPAAIIESAGVLVTGRTLLETFDRLEVLEATAGAVIDAGAVGGARRLDDAVVEDIRAAARLAPPP